MANVALRKEWRTRLKSFARSKQTVRAWCREHDIPVHQFHYWRRQLAESSPLQQQHSGNWMAVAVVPEPATIPKAPGIATPPGGVAIRVAGATIEVSPGFDGELLRAVVQSLESAPC